MWFATFLTSGKTTELPYSFFLLLLIMYNFSLKINSNKVNYSGNHSFQMVKFNCFLLYVHNIDVLYVWVNSVDKVIGRMRHF